ncbi:MAG: TatD family hydrolase [Clostridia bacterium]|nr:TatD family hydrolase [Clostridia bacterium]
MFIDTHAHLTDKIYDANLDEIRANYLSKGVEKIIVVGYNLSSSIKAYELSKRYSEVYFAVGVHPSDAKFYNDEAEKTFISLSKDNKCVAIGEIGLDYHYENIDKDVQKRVFIRQLELANELNLPVILHTRDACGDTVEILKSNSALLKNGFLMHCFSESKEVAKELLPLGAYFAFGGAITFKNAKKQEIIASIPKDRLFAETDAPYLTPVPKRGQVNAPENVVYVYEFMANVLGESVENLKAQFSKNLTTLFKGRI